MNHSIIMSVKIMSDNVLMYSLKRTAIRGRRKGEREAEGKVRHVGKRRQEFISVTKTWNTPCKHWSRGCGQQK